MRYLVDAARKQTINAKELGQLGKTISLKQIITSSAKCMQNLSRWPMTCIGHWTYKDSHLRARPKTLKHVCLNLGPLRQLFVPIFFCMIQEEKGKNHTEKHHNFHGFPSRGGHFNEVWMSMTNIGARLRVGKGMFQTTF